VVEEVVGCAAGEDGDFNLRVFAHLLDGACSSVTVSGTMRLAGGFENVIL
jgi:hypothetical protein